MPSVGLIVEGIYDEAALTKLVQTCFSTEVDIICRPCGGVPQLMKLFPGFLREFEHVNAGLPVDKGIVIRDADQKDPDALISLMESKISGRIYPFTTKCLVIVQNLETWLLADEEALSSVTRRTQRRVSNPEGIIDPKTRLRKILSDVQIDYTAVVAREIAAFARPDVLAARCPSFRKFQEAVVGQ
jgi:Domain of unknown function (DUF4276)